MKILTLNIRHGGGTRIARILAYLQAQDADVLVLTEFRNNPSGQLLRSGLARDSCVHGAVLSTSTAKTNSVGIFAKHAFTAYAVPTLAPIDSHRLIAACFGNFSILGVYFTLGPAKASLFQCLNSCGLDVREPTYVIGDFNTGMHKEDETRSTFHCADQFASLSSTGGFVDSWRSRNPTVREFSWYSHAGNGFRLDHVFATPAADSAVERIYYDPTPRMTGISDHSALIVHTQLA